MSAGRTPSLLEVLESFWAKKHENVHTAFPGIVQKYYPDTQTADVLPAVKTALPDGTFESWPVLPHVPIQWPRGGGYVFAFPLAQGDEVQVLVNEVELTQFRLSGKECEPLDLRDRDASFAVAIPCPMSDPKVSTDADVVAGTALVVGKEGGPKVVIDGTQIKLGTDATDFVALASKIDLFIHTVMGWIPVANDGGAALKTALSTAGFSGTTTTAATLAKAK